MNAPLVRDTWVDENAGMASSPPWAVDNGLESTFYL